MEGSLPRHLCHVQKSSAIINRFHALIHSTALIALIYYRASFLLQNTDTISGHTPIIPWLLVFAGELVLSFIWLLEQAYRWRPVTRAVFPERLPEDKQLPSIDVFICTVDPKKEPTLEVMNTVISAMALDYPPEKLHVYVSDDGGSSLTLYGMKEAWEFARSWVPFCRTHGIKTPCPKAYFSSLEDGDGSEFLGTEFMAERRRVQIEYENFKARLRTASKEGGIRNESMSSPRDHPPGVEVIGADQVEMPLLVYVSREKRPSHPHHFKAGALNVLLRVSGIISNSPYILILDCDMYCNDPTSAQKAMCFHLDPKISPTLAFVQFPQRFHNISKNDIYDSGLRSAFSILLEGLDGLQGPILCGTCFYIKRVAFYGSFIQDDIDILKLRESFGPSNEFIRSLGQNYKPSVSEDGNSLSTIHLQETQLLASCSYENQTMWGKEVGFLYQSVVEDYLTGFIMHCRGWTSVYCNPSKPQFLGSGVTNMNDMLVQGTRWSSGLFDVAISKFSPLIYGPLRMSILESFCYAYLAYFPLYFISVWCFGIIPQLCLLNGIPLYPKVSDSFRMIFAFIFLSSLSKHLYEVLFTGGSFQTWMNEQRNWMIKSVTCHLYGSMDAIMKKIGMREASFLTTNKVVDNEEEKLYQMGKFDFRTSTAILAPVVILVISNMAAFMVGLARVIAAGNWDKMFVQVVLSFYILIMSYPIVEGMILRKDKGRVPPSITLLSTVLAMVLLTLGSTALMY
ncbi:cellulose synthase-like protein G2 [Vitis riparia]|uniref:cellulose synthase-like protein G2 n=1 Tax=Vitis riparia TaxID=96939 RepID=UPI00155ADB8D|nr:cellulose synthase-like protein G2 [Vitis riparia]